MTPGLSFCLTVSLPNRMSTYGMTFIRGSLKNWLMKGAERFMQKILSFSEACWATFRMDSGDTVRKKPCGRETGSVGGGSEGSENTAAVRSCLLTPAH